METINWPDPEVPHIIESDDLPDAGDMDDDLHSEFFFEGQD